MKAAAESLDAAYSLFGRIDGTHPYREAVPDGYVDYPVRTRHGGTVLFFNFRLAKEMGLLTQDHPEQMNPALREKILETFSLVIINEYDQIHKTEFPKKDIRPNLYMATRYLQLQHPDKRGKTSGDGRGIWNGQFKSRGITWDISSSGTGATCLSPACAQEKKFIKTGDKRIGYGNGYNTLDEGMNAALMSEVFHRNGVPTERTLAIIGFENRTSINVRVSRCLLRPSHFFGHLKQGSLAGLKGAVDFFIDRQLSNRDWNIPSDILKDRKRRYEFLANEMALTFARTAAVFESEYVFCWLDWDGDNILANGGIIDYGSVRQFGLFHRGYRYEDVDRYSTSLPEQKAKARYIVQHFAQIRDFLITGRKRRIRRYRDDPLVKLFDRHFQRTGNDLLLKKLGFSGKHREFLLERHMGAIETFRKHATYFERAQSKRRPYKVADGITRDAVFSIRDILRELPKRYAEKPESVSHEEFIGLIKSSYAQPDDLALTPYRRREIDGFQSSYFRLVRLASEKFTERNAKKMLLEICMRSSIINRADRITGDATVEVTQSLIRRIKNLTADHINRVIEDLVEHQRFVPEDGATRSPVSKVKGKAAQLVQETLAIIENYREGL